MFKGVNGLLEKRNDGRYIVRIPKIGLLLRELD
jgi:hypothetical protein